MTILILAAADGGLECFERGIVESDKRFSLVADYGRAVLFKLEYLVIVGW